MYRINVTDIMAMIVTALYIAIHDSLYFTFK
jgi:hypothetical protein